MNKKKWIKRLLITLAVLLCGFAIFEIIVHVLMDSEMSSRDDWNIQLGERMYAPVHVGVQTAVIIVHSPEYLFGFLSSSAVVQIYQGVFPDVLFEHREPFAYIQNVLRILFHKNKVTKNPGKERFIPDVAR